MHALVLLDGEPPVRALYDAYAAFADCVICADGAYNWARGYGITVDVLIGDMDSIEPEYLRALHDASCEILNLPEEKDPTDGQVCLDHALGMGAKEITLMGGGSFERLDHTMGNYQLLLRAEMRGTRARMCTGQCEIHAVSGRRTFKAKAGTRFSLIPWGQDIRVTLKGFQYPLDFHDFHMDTPLGVSNVFTKNTAEIEVIGGWALVFIT